MPFEKRALLIAGPTASGKSALALERAERDGGVIINADALQVYRELSILTARPAPADEARVPHRLYGHVPSAEAYSVGRWLHAARAALDEAWDAGRLPIFVGGTGLYFRALEQGLAELPPVPGEVRSRWRGFAGDLHAELRARDPEAAAKLNARDRQRLARALEVIEATGRSLLDWQRDGAGLAPLRAVMVERIWLDLPRAELHARAGHRFDAMMAAGALEEARQFLSYDADLPAMKAIGLGELLAHLRGEATLDAAVGAAKAATRQYIKRQATWGRGQMPGSRVASVLPMDVSPVTYLAD